MLYLKFFVAICLSCNFFFEFEKEMAKGRVFKTFYSFIVLMTYLIIVTR